MQSDYFDHTLTSGFKEDATRELSFLDHSTYAVWWVFEYICRESYSDKVQENLNTEVKR